MHTYMGRNIDILFLHSCPIFESFTQAIAVDYQNANYTLKSALPNKQRKAESHIKSTANVLFVEYTDVFLSSKFKNKHWLFLHLYVCN